MAILSSSTLQCFYGGALLLLGAFCMGFLVQIMVITNLRSGHQMGLRSVLRPPLEPPLLLPSYNTSHSEMITKKASALPPVVQSWREGKIDWHELLPLHNSQWEWFGSSSEESKFRTLVAKEEQITDFLTQFHESGRYQGLGSDHGRRLEAYSHCDKMQSVCMVHNRTICPLNQLCGWSSSRDICVDGVDLDTSQLSFQSRRCSGQAKVIQNGAFVKQMDESKCKLWVDQPTFLVKFDSESLAMYFHWLKSWGTLLAEVNKALKSTSGNHRHIHFFVNAVRSVEFYQYFGVLSDFCWRRAAETQISPNVCFCSAREIQAGQGMPTIAFREQLVSFLELDHIFPSNERPKIGIISRRRKRFILNEYELVDRMKALLPYEVELLSLESMTLYEQIKALRSLTVLVGIHGSGLTNTYYLHPGAVMLQILPYTLIDPVNFGGMAESAGVHAMNWAVSNTSQAVFHWDLLKEANPGMLKRLSHSEILKEGMRKASLMEVMVFWINQDVIVSVEEFLPVIEKAVHDSSISYSS